MTGTAGEKRKDAAGRGIAVGNVVGGTTSGRYQETIIGSIVSFGKSSALVEVISDRKNDGFRPGDGDKVRIGLGRVFFVRAARDPYEEETGHQVTCLAVAGGGIDPDCCGPLGAS